MKAASNRTGNIQSSVADAPILGAEYDIAGRTFLLRVAGDLKPSERRGIRRCSRQMDVDFVWTTKKTGTTGR